MHVSVDHEKKSTITKVLKEPLPSPTERMGDPWWFRSSNWSYVSGLPHTSSPLQRSLHRALYPLKKASSVEASWKNGSSPIMLLLRATCDPGNRRFSWAGTIPILSSLCTQFCQPEPRHDWNQRQPSSPTDPVLAERIVESGRFQTSSSLSPPFFKVDIKNKN